jgi:predicted Zn-dependent protease
LTPEEPAALAAATVIPILMGSLRDSGGGWDETKVAAALEAPTRDLERRLSRPGTSRDARARSLEVLAILHVLREEFGPAAERARQSVALAPGRSAATEVLVGALSQEGRAAEAIPTLRARLARRESARDRVLLAKCYAAAGRNAEAEATLSAGRTRAAAGAGSPSKGDRRVLDLAYAAALLRTGRLPEADVHLTRLEAGQSAFEDEERELLRLLRAAHGALSGKDVEAARAAFVAVVGEGGEYTKEAAALRDALPASE